MASLWTSKITLWLLVTMWLLVGRTGCRACLLMLTWDYLKRYK
jgi:hypothetical protein